MSINTEIPQGPEVVCPKTQLPCSMSSMVIKTYNQVNELHDAMLGTYEKKGIVAMVRTHDEILISGHEGRKPLPITVAKLDEQSRDSKTIERGLIFVTCAVVMGALEYLWHRLGAGK